MLKFICLQRYLIIFHMHYSLNMIDDLLHQRYIPFKGVVKYREWFTFVYFLKHI